MRIIRKLIAQACSSVARAARRDARRFDAAARHFDLSRDRQGLELAEEAAYRAGCKAEAFEALADWLVP